MYSDTVGAPRILPADCLLPLLLAIVGCTTTSKRAAFAEQPRPSQPFRLMSNSEKVAPHTFAEQFPEINRALTSAGKGVKSGSTGVQTKLVRNAKGGIEELYLVGIRPNQRLLDEIGSMVTIKVLWIDGSTSDSIDFRPLGSLSEMHSLTLSQQRFLPRGLTFLNNLISLRSLQLAFCVGLRGNMKYIADLAELDHLFLTGSDVSDGDLASLGSMAKLRWLTLWGTSINDGAIDSLLKLPSPQLLLELDLTKLTQKGVNRIRGARPSWSVRADLLDDG